LIDAIDVTDGSRGIPLVPPSDFITLIREELGWNQKDKLELIPHFTCRDLNVMGLQSRLIGFYVQNIHNVLFITGDPPKMSPNYPRSTAVFDCNSIDMIHLTHSLLNSGLDFGERPLASHSDPRTHFTIGTGFEPESLDLQKEIEKLKRKIDAGTDYVMTQPAFRMEALQILEKYQEQVAVLPGVMILRGLDHAGRISEVPGVVIPEEVFERLQRFEKKADQLKAGIELASEQIRLIRRSGWAGLYLMSPGSSEGVFETLTFGLT
jgi:homocysteine S-methyltransferase